jgi:hypothetical protein
MQNLPTKSGFNIVSILGLIFITLKLMGYINWSWWLITLPFWGGISLILFLGIVGIIYYSLKNKFENLENK